MCRAVKVLGKRGTSGELPHALLEVSSVIGVAHELGTTSGNRLGHGEGMGLEPGAGCGQAEQSLCRDLGVINAPQTFGRKEQPGKLDAVGDSLAALAVQLRSPGTPLLKYAYWSCARTTSSHSFLIYKMRSWTRFWEGCALTLCSFMEKVALGSNRAQSDRNREGLLSFCTV